MIEFENWKPGLRLVLSVNLDKKFQVIKIAILSIISPNMYSIYNVENACLKMMESKYIL